MEQPRRRSYEAVVIGAGLIGLATAWRAAQRGLSVLVLERERAGSGASGVAAGMLAPVTEAGFREERLLELSLAGRRLWPGFAAELEERTGLGCGYSESGALVAAVDRDDAEELRRLHGFHRSLGLESDWLTAREIRRREPGLSPRVAGGVLAPGDGHVDPRATAAALHAALNEAGGELLEGAEALELVRESGRVTGVRLAGARIGADAVVVAAGAWSPALAPEPPGPPVRPVKGQLLELRARPGSAPLPERILRTPRCYLLARADGRVVVGATVEERGFDTSVTAGGVHELLEAAWELYPDVAELELVGARAGLRPGTPDNAPLVGRDEEEGLLWATGHHRNGVLLAPITARALAAMLAGEPAPEELAAFDPRRFREPVRA